MLPSWRKQKKHTCACALLATPRHHSPASTHAMCMWMVWRFCARCMAGSVATSFCTLKPCVVTWLKDENASFKFERGEISVVVMVHINSFPYISLHVKWGFQIMGWMSLYKRWRCLFENNRIESSPFSIPFVLRCIRLLRSCGRRAPFVGRVVSLKPGPLLILHELGQISFGISPIYTHKLWPESKKCPKL